MGIKNLSTILKKYAPESISLIKITDIKGSTVAIDANLFIYRSVFAIRKGMGKDVENKVNGKIFKATHIYIMFIRLFGFVKMNIKPVFVFDSSYSYLKEKTMKNRKELRNNLKHKYLNAKTDKEKQKYYHVSEDITHDEYDDIIALIELFGFPYIISPEEADSQCAYLIKKNYVDYIISDDMDLLLFGCNKIIRRFTISKHKKMELITLSKVTNSMNMSMDSFIQLGILLGSDYAETVKGIGMKKAYEIIKKYKNIENAKLNKQIPSTYEYINAFNYFKKGKYDRVTKQNIKQHKINSINLKKFMLNKGFKDSNTINSYLDKL